MIDHLYSDPHFHHKNIIKYCNRPFADIVEMNEQMIGLYNDKVKDNQTTLWCGDCFFCSIEQATEIVSRLHGRKLLLLGNHDKSADSMAKIGFDLVYAGELVMSVNNIPVRISHFPYASHPGEYDGPDKFSHLRPKPRKGEVLIHGHTHQKEKRIKNMVHVGVDSWDHAPAPYEEVVKEVREAAKES